MAKLIFEHGSLRVWAEPVDRCGDRLRSAAMQRAAVAKLLMESINVETLGHHPDGAPYIPGNAATVSLSHCRDIVVLAVDSSGRRLGVDAETANRSNQLQRVVHKFLSYGQIPLWGVSEQMLLKAWTIKEALYKACRIPGLPLTEIPLPDSSGEVAQLKFVHPLILKYHEGNCTNFVIREIHFAHFNGVISLVHELF